MKNLSIGKKVHVPLIISVLIGFVIIIANYIYSTDSIKDETYLKEEKSLRSFF